MSQKKNLADYHHPLVVQKAKELTSGEDTQRGKIEKLFYYVRDEIKFGFLPEFDYLTASEIIQRKMGQSNNKGVLFFSLCKALDIPVRMHFSIIKKEVQRDLIKGLAFKIMPENLSHCWVEVLAENKWRSIGAYINEEQNVQLDAMVQDQGVYDDPSDYFYSRRYINKVFFVNFFIIQHIIFPRVNDRVSKMRQSCCSGFCGDHNTGRCISRNKINKVKNAHLLIEM